MSTVFVRRALFSIVLWPAVHSRYNHLLECCRNHRLILYRGTVPRTWADIVINGSYGAFEMVVAAITISQPRGPLSSIIVDSVALHEVER